MLDTTLTSIVSSAAITMGRIGTIASVGLLSLFVIGSIQAGDSVPTMTEAIGIGFFPIGVVIGMLLGWRWPLTGACLSLISLTGFYVWIFIVSGRFNNGPYFVIFTLPAFFYLLGAMSAKRKSQLAFETTTGS